MEWKEYLQNKKIDHESFESDEPGRYTQLKNYFEQVHPDSFTAQKLFLINKIRRKYPQKAAEKTEKSRPEKRTAKPKMIPKIKK